MYFHVRPHSLQSDEGQRSIINLVSNIAEPQKYKTLQSSEHHYMFGRYCSSASFSTNLPLLVHAFCILYWSMHFIFSTGPCILYSLLVHAFCMLGVCMILTI